MIYERIAEVLAPYNVTMRNFIDYGELQRYESARVEAQKALRFTKTELESIYADDGGGVKLTESESARSAELEDRRRKQGQESDAEHVQDDFFPPLCHCDEPCILARILTARNHYA